MKLVLFSMLAAIVQNNVSGLKCHKCVSVADSDCSSNAKQKKFHHECLPDIEAEGDLFECGVGTASVNAGFKKFIVTARGCVPKASGKQACEKMLSIGGAVKVIKCNTCETNLCNLASSPTKNQVESYIFMSFSLVVFYMAWR